MAGEDRRRAAAWTVLVHDDITAMFEALDGERRFTEQSMTLDREARLRLVREIDIQLQRDVARPILYQSGGATCRYPHVHGIRLARNSIYNHWRLEDAWMAPR